MRDVALRQTAPRFAAIRNETGQRVSDNLLIVLLIFWIVLAVYMALSQGLFYLIIAAFPQIGGVPDGDLLLLLALNVFQILLTVLCTGLLEHRSLRTLQVTKKHLLRDYFLGLLLGIALFSAVIGLSLLGGAAEISDSANAFNPLMMFFLIIGWAVQGFAEEITFRGWLMMSAGTHFPPWIAVAVSALSFAAAHLGNAGISIPAFLNLVLFGIAMSLLVLRTGTIWIAAAVHSCWNWAEGNFYGLQVSGFQTECTVLCTRQTGAAEWLGGGAFGPEGGAAAAAVFLLMIVILLCCPQRSSAEERISPHESSEKLS